MHISVSVSIITFNKIMADLQASYNPVSYQYMHHENIKCFQVKRTTFQFPKELVYNVEQKTSYYSTYINPPILTTVLELNRHFWH